MMRLLTIDSSVIIASLLEREPRHLEAKEIWESVLSGENHAVMPWTVFVEIVAAVRRRTGLEKLAGNMAKQLRTIDAVSFVSLDDKSAADAAALAGKTGLRGMDAIVVQVAREFKAELISFDIEMMTKVALLERKKAK